MKQQRPKLFKCIYNEMSGPIYVIGQQEMFIAGASLMWIVISEKHANPMQGAITSDFSVVNMFSFYFNFYGIL
jgi:hypothetical protein